MLQNQVREPINSSVECCLIISLNRLRCKHRPQIASRNDKVIGSGFWPKAFIYAALVEFLAQGLNVEVQRRPARAAALVRVGRSFVT